MDNVRILPLESNSTRLLLYKRFTKSKAQQSCVAAVILTGVPATILSECSYPSARRLKT